MKKKRFYIFFVLAMVLVLCGCVQTETVFNIREDGMADINFKIKANQAMAGDEVDIFTWGLINSFVELQKNYTITRDVKSIDYSDYIIYEFKSLNSVPINDNKNIVFKKTEEGNYIFKLKIPPLLDEVTEDNKDELLFTFIVSLPEEIDMANSMKINGKTVIWNIYKGDLVEGTELKAYTK